MNSERNSHQQEKTIQLQQEITGPVENKKL
jgi:hypothetical protein